jgi:hypothetical protein
VCPAAIVLMPFVIGCIILVKFGKDDVARYIGFLSLIPVLTNAIAFFLGANSFWKIGPIYLYEIVGFVYGILETIPMLIIIFNSRHLRKQEKLLRTFLTWGIVRWLYILVYLGFVKTSPEPYFYWQAYLAIFFAFVFPSIYAIAGLIFSRKHFANKNSSTSS